MTKINHSSLPVPEPLRGSEIGSFAHDTIVRRLPEIVKRTLAENEFSFTIEKDLQTLIDEIPTADIRPIVDPEAIDSAEWDSYVEPYLDNNWLEVPWFFAEFYLYRRILEATGYFRVGGEGHLRDPYLLQKKRGLESTVNVLEPLCARNNRWVDQKDLSSDALAGVFLSDLWGNKADLSLWPIGDRSQEGFTQEKEGQERVVVNHLTELVASLNSLEPGKTRIDLLLDNAGFELVADLLLTDFLMGTGLADKVILYPKAYPVFVSDTLQEDVEKTIAFIESQPSSSCQRVGKRIRSYLEDERLVYHQDIFWTSPLSMWEMPKGLRTYLEGANLVISKGDANYRRLLGDRDWPYTTPFHEIMSYFPVSIVALRICKSDVMCGLAPGQAEALTEADPDWMTNGQWGMIQHMP